MSLSPGQAFGNYRILSRIAVGGMGMVFLAEHPQIGKRVALKIIHRDLAGNRELVNRFLNEARAVNQIGSEHIVQIHDFGQTEAGEHFFIMEYLDGRTLAHELAAWGALEVPRALHIAAQMASALAMAHDASIIHRDLKPDNVMLIDRLGDPDFVKLLDFGLAKFLVDTEGRRLTAAGVVLGTPQFMSPEACESRPDVDQRSDVYSLGVLIFQMVTGQLPFTGESMAEVLIKQVTEPPPAPRGINPHVPVAVEQVVLRCLAKSPDRRFQTMRELHGALLEPAGYLASSPRAIAFAAMPDAPTLFRAGAADDRPTEITVDMSASGQATSAADARTAFMDEAVHRLFAAQGAHRAAAQPAAPIESRTTDIEKRTTEIDTPHGRSVSPRRRLWLFMAAVLVAGAAAALLLPRARLDRKGTGSPQSGADERAGASEGKPGRSAGVGAAAADAGPDVARIRLTTRPSGAEVSDAAGNRIGITPTEIELPMDDREVVLRFRHPEAADLERRFTPIGDAALDIELPPSPMPPSVAAASSSPESGPGEPTADRPPAPSRERQRPRHRPKKPRKPKSDLLRPEF